MNEIVSVKDENNLDENYKLVYPNNKGLAVRLYESNTSLLTHSSDSCFLRFFEILLNINDLFIEKTNYQKIVSEYRPWFRLVFTSFKNDSFKDEYNIKNVKVLNEQHKSIEIKYPKKIKEIYFSTENNTVAIVIDSNFCSKHEKKQTAELKEKENLSNSVKDLLN